jgi:bifunctional DNA-binding transcriptional regulator/antitoxin component of YhaV-PrlF toxin-antitoxin module
MAKSTLTSKHQTTIPREVREGLGVRPGDVLRWEILGNEVRVTTADTAFLRYQGRFKVEPGSVVEDIRKAREMRGKDQG